MIDRPDALTGRVAVVTGGADGIGLATATHLAAAGATLVLVDLSPALPDVAAALADDHDVAVLPIIADVADEHAMAAGFARVAAEFGRLDVLVNNAGIMTPHLEPVHEVALSDFDAMLRVHLRGAFVCAQLAVPLMRRGSFGRIVNLTSVLGALGLPNRSAYAMAKTGVIGLTRSLAVEGGRYGITANAVLPGWILTGRLRARLAAGTLDHDRYAARTPVGRWGDPADVARMITFLALPSSGFLTGGVFPVDGGYCVRGDADEDIGPLHSGQEAG
ncbi:SDR family NAD(P)-dependent oxidoreductase [Actinophytocola sp. NPDC049390]|uniref:SDR family NAD(P)-dependent oxidoreductase n=1 Tax=Actinophytocola sp. NPDC049390 TaxID=3363894 RepID=UPI0037950014